MTLPREIVALIDDLTDLGRVDGSPAIQTAIETIRRLSSQCAEKETRLREAERLVKQAKFWLPYDGVQLSRADNAVLRKLDEEITQFLKQPTP